MNFREIIYGRTDPVSPDERMEEIEIERNPPACVRCTAPAKYCLLTEHPVCHDCFSGVLEEWRARVKPQFDRVAITAADFDALRRRA